MTETYSGSCLCGSIRIKLEGKPENVYICYCSDCRKNSGHLGQINAGYKTDKLEVIDPKEHLAKYTITDTGSGKPKHKFFCGNCGCTIRTLCESLPGETYVRIMILDNGEGDFVPQEALYEEEKVRFTKGSKSKYFGGT